MTEQDWKNESKLYGTAWKKLVMDLMKMAHETVEEWCKSYGDKEAWRMLREGDWSEPYRSCLRTAWGE